MRLVALFFCLLGVPALAEAPGVQQAFDRADFAACLGLSAHPEDPVRVTLVVHADGAWAVGLDPFEDAPPEVLYDCVTDLLHEALQGGAVPHREAFFSRTVQVPAGPAERFQARSDAISQCVLTRLPRLEHLVVRLRLTTTARGVIEVSPLDSLEGAREAVACTRKHLGALRPEASQAEVELAVDRPGALPAHDGRLGAVCQWGEGHEGVTLPRPRACRPGLVCTGCSGGIERKPGGEVERHCMSASFRCPLVP